MMRRGNCMIDGLRIGYIGDRVGLFSVDVFERRLYKARATLPSRQPSAAL